MIEESDLVQEVALAYGERFVLQNFHNICKEQNNPLLDKVCALYGAMIIKKHLSWYLQEGILKASSCRSLDAKINATCKKLNERLEELLDGFGIPAHLILLLSQKIGNPITIKEKITRERSTRNILFSQKKRRSPRKRSR